MAEEKTYLELSEGSSHKFYEIVVNGVEVTVRFGRIGLGAGSSQRGEGTSAYRLKSRTAAQTVRVRHGVSLVGMLDGNTLNEVASTG